jgi:aarF domain-containing kinase
VREALVRLGPCFIKLGQALSVRPDLVGPDGMRELRGLCDAVPSFEGGVAWAVVEEELGRGVWDVFSELSAEPVAAASLGQVHKGRLRDGGREVAVKVQRPDLRRKVSLDIYCLQAVARGANALQARLTGGQTDFVALLNEWARGTYAELDYVNEKMNSRRFAALVHRKMPEIYVPAVYDEWTTRKVLTMEWIDGVPLTDCPPDQINELVQTGVNVFLLQLLSMGFFHSDPHSGNLIRLASGRLCIIDFGLCSVIGKAEMDAMVKAIIDLGNRNYAGCVRDFIALNFLPPDVDRAAVEAVIAPILDQALQGGGAKSINFETLSDDLAGVTFDFPFKIPPAFALLLRALSVLEGIALTGDSEFKLIMASLPFVSRLILTDRSPVLREALTDTLYKDGVFSPTRLRVLLDSSQGIIADGSAFIDFDSPADGSAVVTADALDLLFSDDGLVLREILSDELAKSLDLLAREAYTRSTAALSDALSGLLPAGLRGLVPAPAAMMPAAGAPPPSVALPWLVAPGKLAFALPPISPAEREQLNGMRDVVAWLTDGGADMRKLMDLLPSVIARSGVLGRMVAGRMSETFARRLFDELLRGGGEAVAGRRRVGARRTG